MSAIKESDQVSTAGEVGRKYADRAKMEGLFSGTDDATWGKVLGADQMDALNGQLKGSLDPTRDRMVMANKALMADRFGMKASEVTQQYERLRDGYAKQVFKTEGPIDDATFYSHAGAFLQKERAIGQMFHDTSAMLADAIKTGTDFGQWWKDSQETLKANPGWDDSKSDYFMHSMNVMFDEMKEKLSNYEPQMAAAEKMFEVMKERGNTNQDPEKSLEFDKIWQAGTAALANIPKEDRGMVMDMIFAKAKQAGLEGEARGAYGKFDDSVGRGIQGFARQVARTVTGATGNEQAKAMQDAAAEFEGRYNGTIDPIKSDSWIGQGMIDFGESFARSVSFMTPAGLVLNSAASFSDLKDEFEMEGVDPKAAGILAAIGTPIYTYIEFVQAKMVFGGKVPFLGKAMEPIKRAVQAKWPQLFARAGATLAVQAVENALQEAAQFAVRPTMQDIAGIFNEAIPDVKFVDEWAKLKIEAPRTAGALLPMILIGTGTATFQDAAFGKAYLKEANNYKAAGFSDTQTDAILSMPETDRAAAIAGMWDKRDGFGQGMTDAQEIILDQMDEAEDRLNMPEVEQAKGKPLPEYARFTVQQAEVMENGETMPGFVQVDIGDPAKLEDGERGESTNPDELRSRGFYVPEVPVNLPNGNYTLAEIMAAQESAPKPEGPGYTVTRDGNGYTVMKGKQFIGQASTPWGANQLIQAEEAAGAQPTSGVEEADSSIAGASLETGTDSMQWFPSQPNAARALEKRDPQGTPLKGANAPQVIKGFERILKFLGIKDLDSSSPTYGKNIGQPGKGLVRPGRMGSNAKRALGYYQRKERLIRMRMATDIETAAHEVAHAIDDALWGIHSPTQSHWDGSLSNQPATVDKASQNELFTLGKQLYGKQVPAGSYWSEGFSEFFRLWMTDPEQLITKAPNVLKWWEGDFAKQHPKMFKALKSGQEAGVTFYRQGALERARNSIVEGKDFLDSFSETMKDQISNARKNWIDTGAAIQDFVKWANANRLAYGMTPIASERDPAVTMTQRTLTADSVVRHMAERGMVNWQGAKVGPSLKEALDVARAGGKDANDFMIYLWARRAIALWTDKKNGPRNPGITLKDATYVYNQLHDANFAKAASMVYDWNNGVLNYAAQASGDFRRIVDLIRMTDPGQYIPLFREFHSLDKSFGGMAGVNRSQLVKRLKGSSRRILDPVESMLTMSKNIVLKAQQKAVLDQIILIARTTPGLGLMAQKVPIEKVKERVPGWQVFEKLRQKVIRKVAEEKAGQGMTPQAAAQEGKDAADAMIDPLEELLGNGGFDFFLPAFNPKQNEWPILPISNGKVTEWWEFDPEIFKSLSGMDMVQLHPALRAFFVMPASVARLGTTGLRASFGLVTNPIRDFRTLMMNSRATASTRQLFGYFLSGVRDSAALFLNEHANTKLQTEWGDIFEASGVKMAQLLQQDTRPLTRAARRLKGEGWKISNISGHMDLLRDLFGIMEGATRIAEMRAVAKDLGWDPSMPMTPKIAQALAVAGKQVTTDFTSAGRYARVYNQMVPFFNAGIQGPRAHIRALQRDPSKFMMRGLQGTALALSLWWMNKDEEWWKDMDDEERYLFSYFKLPNGELLRLPRAFEVDGIFMAGAEALADAWYQEEPEIAAGWIGQFVQNISQVNMVNGYPVIPIPLTAEFALEQAANRDFFFDTPIVPRSEADLAPEEQYNDFTSSVAVRLGSILGVSPRRIDHAISSFTGPAGINLAKVGGRGGNLGPAGLTRDAELSDIPVVGVLFQRGGQVARNSRSVNDLYDSYGKALQVQRSKKAEETNDQRNVRLMLTDAVKAQAALTDLARVEESAEKRREILALRVQVATKAVQMAESGKVDRGFALRIGAKARAEVLKAEQANDNQ